MNKINNKRSRLVAICAAGLHKEDVSDLVRAVSQSCSKLGFRTIVFNAFTDMYKSDAFSIGESSIYSLAGSELVDAVVLLPESLKNDVISSSIAGKALARGIPVVCINGSIEGCVSIRFNYGESFEEIIRHVINVHNCRRINFVAGMKGNSFSEERIERFKAVLAENGIEFDERRLGYGDFWETPAAAVAESWFESSLPLPEAVICANDSMAMAVCRVLKEHGIRVPQDIIVTGFDGIRLEKYHTPRLTTSACDPKDAGKAAAEVLRAAFAGEEHPRQIVIPFKMRVSQSCGCHKVHSALIANRIMELNAEMVGVDAHETYMFDYLGRALSCKSPKKLAEVMKKYSHVPTWCCLDTGFFSDHRSSAHFGAMPAHVQLLMTNTEAKNGREFDSREILPRLTELLDEDHDLIFCPLHNDAKVIGYIVFLIDIGYYDLRRAMRFTMLTNQILETIKNRRTIELANEKLANMHIHDPLTGVLNRRGFYKQAAAMIRKINSENTSASIISADMDGLKQINDSYGHSLGDKAIKALARALVKCAGEDAVCSRFGGDEFIIMTTRSDSGFISEYNRKVRQELDDHVRRARLPFKIGVSIGVISSRFSSSDMLDECIRIADEKMYRNKRENKKAAHQGRN